MSIKNWDPMNVEVIYRDSAYGVSAKTLKMRPDSTAPKKVEKKKFYWILYSECDQTIETVVEVTPEQIKKQ